VGVTDSVAVADDVGVTDSVAVADGVGVTDELGETNSVAVAEGVGMPDVLGVGSLDDDMVRVGVRVPVRVLEAALVTVRETDVDGVGVVAAVCDTVTVRVLEAALEAVRDAAGDCEGAMWLLGVAVGVLDGDDTR